MLVVVLQGIALCAEFVRHEGLGAVSIDAAGATERVVASREPKEIIREWVGQRDATWFNKTVVVVQADGDNVYLVGKDGTANVDDAHRYDAHAVDHVVGTLKDNTETDIKWVIDSQDLKLTKMLPVDTLNSEGCYRFKSETETTDGSWVEALQEVMKVGGMDGIENGDLKKKLADDIVTIATTKGLAWFKATDSYQVPAEMLEAKKLSMPGSQGQIDNVPVICMRH